MLSSSFSLRLSEVLFERKVPTYNEERKDEEYFISWKFYNTDFTHRYEKKILAPIL